MIVRSYGFSVRFVQFYIVFSFIKNSDHESKNFQAHSRTEGFGFLPGPYDLNADGVTREAMCLKNFGHGWRPLSAGDDIEMAAKVRFYLVVSRFLKIVQIRMTIVGRF